MFKYKSGYKYLVDENYFVKLPEYPKPLVETVFIGVDGKTYMYLEPNFRLTIGAGYAWDGASGPAIDTKTIMRGSLVHDALYQFMREGELDPKVWRPYADKVFRQICLEDGMNPIRAWYVYYAVRLFGGKYAGENNE